ncbi:immunity 22 family protein [uncultured Lacinutrix sp.]|uniref:immunity 22 family protein n=1 Tax=uncultured Lacinutrix sp. TaxID=574032 RepID=UPI00262EE7E1|nr:immunity 22 family protein [uncultured Lacinutrix sp.]
MPKKVICVWIGTFKSENELYQNYLNFDYENEDDPKSKFGKDAELEYYDEDFMESWWLEDISLNNLIEHKDNILDSEYFFEELIAELKHWNLTNKNSITFLFGEDGEHATNDMLFDYNGMKSKDKPIAFVFRKEYELK